MKTKNNQTIVLSIKEMEAIVSKMKENKLEESTMRDNAMFELYYDTDYSSYRIDAESKGYQFGGYAECFGKVIKI